jgi:hypothetical protein
LPDSKNVGSEARDLSSHLEGTAFQLRSSEGRKYVRVELSSPVQFRLLTCQEKKIRLSREPSAAEILNLGEGGMLLTTDSVVPEEGFMLLALSLNEIVVLEGVLGKIKRVEPSGEGDFLVGLQFVSREELEKLTSLDEIERLPVKVTSFDCKLRQVVSSYLRTVEFAAG